MPEAVYAKVRDFVAGQAAIAGVGVYLGAEHLEKVSNTRPPVIVVYPLEMELQRGGSIRSEGTPTRALATGRKSIAFFCTAHSYQGAEQVAGLVVAALGGDGVQLSRLEYSEADTDSRVRVAVLELQVAAAWSAETVVATVREVIARCACMEGGIWKQ